MYIIKEPVKHCEVCDKIEAPRIPDPDFVQNEAGDAEVETIPDPKWKGVTGYVFGESRESWRRTECCYACMTKIIKAVSLISKENLTSIDL